MGPHVGRPAFGIAEDTEDLVNPHGPVAVRARPRNERRGPSLDNGGLTK